MSQFEELQGVLSKEEILERTREYDDTAVVEVPYSELVFDTDPETHAYTVRTPENGVISLGSPSPTDPSRPISTILRDIGLNKYDSHIPATRRNELIIPQLRFWYPEMQPEKNLRILVSPDGRAIMTVPEADFEHVSMVELIDSVERVLGAYESPVEERQTRCHEHDETGRHEHETGVTGIKHDVLPFLPGCL